LADIRYGGGHEDANQELSHLRKIATATESLIAKERTRRQELGLTGDAEATAAEQARLAAQAQNELAVRSPVSSRRSSSSARQRQRRRVRRRRRWRS
jgi:hypothetical protein